jgi:hypothetical protein
MTVPAANRTTGLAEELRLSERLSRMQGQEIGPSDVIRVLQSAGVEHVLVGAHAISALAGDPRATMDVEVIAEHPERARDALAAAYPDLRVEEHPVAIRFKRENREAIDIIRPSSSPVFRAALQHTRRVPMADVQAVVPTLEMALALKFAAMVSIGRQVKDRYQDAHDFIALVERAGSAEDQTLSRLGELVYPGGGQEILKLVADARAGRRLEF